MKEVVRKAACVVLLRQGADGVEVYLVLRSQELHVMGGFHSFPGGTVDAVDSQVDLANAGDDAASRIAAIRELFEETGVLCANSSTAVDPSLRKAMREKVLADASTFPACLSQLGAELDATLLIPFGQWRTPAFTHVRFDARYYAVWLPPGEVAEVWPGELAEGFWITPRDAIAQHEQGKLFISYPVFETLRLLQAHGCCPTLAAEAAVVPYPHEAGEMLLGIRMLPLRTPTLPPATHTNCYVLGRQELIVVDPATPYPDEQERLLAHLRALEQGGAKVTEVWLTHHHPDHVGAASLVRDTFNAPIAAHAKTAERVWDAHKLRVDRLINDGDVTHLRREPGPPAEWVAMHTPGHADGHLCFYERTLRSLLSGDNVLGVGSVIVALPEGNMTDYLHSLERMRALDIGLLFPAHGPPIATARRKIDAYIEHRLSRERTIIAVLQAQGPSTNQAVTALVYRDITPDLLPLAELSMQAHLQKLVQEGRVLDRDGEFALTDHP